MNFTQKDYSIISLLYIYRNIQKYIFKISTMKTTTKGLLVGVLILASAVTYGQLTLSGEFRPRTEFRHGYKSVADSNQDPAIYTNQRTRFNVSYKTEGYKVKMVLQDIRTWGSQQQLVSNMNNSNQTGVLTGIHEAWGEAFLNDNWSLKFGRQEIAYDDQRVFGANDWAQQARSHDALLIKYKKEDVQLDIAGAYNQDAAGLIGTSASQGSYKSFQSVWFHKDINDKLQTSILFLNNGMQVDYNPDTSGNMQSYHDNYTQTVGNHTKYKKDKLSVVLNAYYQMGATDNQKISGQNAPAKSLNAYLLGLDISYKLSDNISTTAGFEMQSGNSQTDTTAAYTEEQHAFFPLYGTNHKFNGLIDYFYVGNWRGSVGLQDIYFKLKYKKEKSYVGLDVHLFSAAAPVWDKYTHAEDFAVGNSTPEYKEMSSYLGSELDLSFGMPLSKGVMFKAGFSMMMASETLAYLNGTTYNHNAITHQDGEIVGKGRIDAMNTWAYAMIIIKPTFLKAE